MSQLAHSVNANGVVRETSGALEFRIFRAMIVSVIAAVSISAIFAPWRFTAGLAVGGGLSLLNYHWLQSSITTIFSDNAATQRPRAQSWRYVFRYFVVGIIVLALYKLHLVSLPATFAGLCSFVPALFVEAFRQFYFAIIHREESY